MPPGPLDRLRQACLALPEAHEAEAWGAPTFRVRNKLFAMYSSADTHHGSGRDAVWCKAAPHNQAMMVGAAPKRFFVPPYVGPGGWVGVWLNGRTNFRELAELLADGYRMVAPKRLLARLDEKGSPHSEGDRREHAPPVPRPRPPGPARRGRRLSR